MAIANGMSSFIDDQLCWLNHNDIKDDSSVPALEQKFTAIKNSKCVIFLLSKNSIASQVIADELKFAFEQKKKIITFKIDDLEPLSEITSYLDDSLTFNGFEGTVFDTLTKLEQIIDL